MQNSTAIANDMDVLDAFLHAQGINNAQFTPVGEDMAPRRYYRIHADGVEKKLICIGPPDDDPAAHIGHLVRNTVRLSDALIAHGIRVPRVYASDPAQGFALVEDFGDMRMDQAIAAGEISAEDAYNYAAEIARKLAAINDISGLNDYYASHVHAGRSKLVQWYLPILLQRKVDANFVDEYIDIWDAVEAAVEKPRECFSHIDFHLMNLMYLDGHEGVECIGVLDYQGAMRAPYVYDLVNLLDDARRIVPDHIKCSAIDAFTKNMNAKELMLFNAHYAILSAQFHSRCLGQFIELAFMGKGQYLQYLPSLLKQFKADMQAPVLAPLKAWLDAQGMDFDTPLHVDVDAAAKWLKV